MSFYDDASWLLIPEGIEEDIVFAQKPTNGLGDLTFTRASDATRTNSAGVVERTPWNLFQDSEMFSTTYWGKQRATISANVATAPNGTLTADKLIDTNVNGTHIVFAVISQPSTPRRNQTFSFYAKAGERNWVTSSGDMGTTYFNLATGQVGTVTTSTFWFSGITASMENVGNGWYRCTLSGFGFFEFNVGIRLATANGTDSYTGDNTSGAFIWGAQLVEGTDAKPYFATTNRQDVPRLDYRNADGSVSTCPRLLLEPQRTNSLRNSTMVGAVAGSPGTLPTNWNQGGWTSLTRQIVATPVVNGLQCIDVRFSGTASQNTMQIVPESITQIAASAGQVWTASYYASVVAAPNPYNSANASIFWLGGVAGPSQTTTLTSTLSRFAVTGTAPASTTHGTPAIGFALTIGATYDFTIRIAAPQMELGAYATTFIPTTTAAVTRLIDAASKTGVSSLIGQTEGTLFADVEYGNIDTSDQTIITLFQNSTNRFGIGAYRSGANNFLQFYCLSSSSVTVNINTIRTAGRYKLAGAYKNNDWVFYINGTQIGIDTSSPVPTASDLYIGTSASFTASFGNGINQAALFTRRFTNAELAQITTL
jgi:hypothetical protein